jgi:hypothetical protein
MMNPSLDDQWIGLSDRITSGKNHLSSVDRSPLSDETIVLSWNELSGWQIRALIDDNDPDIGELNFLDELRVYLGLDEQNFAILTAGVAITVLILCLIVLSTMSVNALKWAGRKRKKVAVGNIVLEENVVDIVESTDIEIKSSEIELIDIELTDGANLRKERRQDRKTVTIQNDATPMPSLITSTIESDIQIPTLNRPVICPTCTARFEAAMELKMVKCPICDSRINL